MNLVLMIGGELCARSAALLDPRRWRCVGLRRRAMPAAPDAPLAWRQADLADPESLRACLVDLAPTHLLYAPTPDARTPEAYARAYPLGLAHVLDALAPKATLRRGIVVDSTAVWAHGDPRRNDLVDDTTPPAPADFRGEQMLAAEALLHAHLPREGIALRLSGLYGPGRTQLVDRLKAGRVTAPEGPGHWANRIHIEDAASACAHLLDVANPDPAYIGTDDTPTPTAILYTALAQQVDAPPPPRVPSIGHGKRLSNQRLRASGWQPRWPETIAGYAALLDDIPSRTTP